MPLVREAFFLSGKSEVGRPKWEEVFDLRTPDFVLYFFSDRYLSASIAALHPEPAAVTACR